MTAPVLALRNAPAHQGQVVVAAADAALARRALLGPAAASRSHVRMTAANVEVTTTTTAPPPPPTAPRRAAVTPKRTLQRSAPKPVAPAAPKPKPAPATTAAPRPASATGHSQTGKATYYNAADGDCANNAAPMGTVLTVTNLANGRSVTCRVVSRGPYGGGRIVDLAKSTFARLAPTSTGVIDVRVDW